MARSVVMNCKLTSLLLISATLVSAACGGLVVFEEDGGEGGAGGQNPATTYVTAGVFVTSTTGATTTGMGAPCDLLTDELETAIDHARACSPLEPVVQCDGSAILLDLCGCPSVVANEHNQLEINDARAAYEAWVAAGCGPYECESCTPAKMGGFCFAPGDGTKGRCEAILPD
jgi:hypothetical protein